MEEYNNPREKSERSYRLFKRVYDFSMATLILGCAVLMLGAKWLKLDQILNVDAEFRTIFGVMCLLYGGFRLYRGVSSDY
ncbi:MAG: hypothetical protein NTZ82_04890 [Bacteroidetes bacterium]|nr:hypothetical protein [Bacteroidota bacterium]